jgi:hypothetical protein
VEPVESRSERNPGKAPTRAPASRRDAMNPIVESGAGLQVCQNEKCETTKIPLAMNA